MLSNSVSLSALIQKYIADGILTNESIYWVTSIAQLSALLALVLSQSKGDTS